MHVQFYLTLLDTYVPDEAERHRGVRGGREHPVDPAQGRVLLPLDRLDLRRCDRAGDQRATGGAFLLNLICFAACIEGLFFFGAFAYVYFLRSRGLLHGLAAGTNWVFRDESMHMAFAFDVVDTVRARGAGPVRRRAGSSRSGEMLDEARRRARRSSPRTCSGRAWPGCRRPTCASTCEYVADQRLRAARPAAASTGRRTRSRSWSCRTCRS